MRKTILYILLFSGILFMAGAYIYRQYQYKKFEEFFMDARLYGSNKMIADTSFTKINKDLGLELKEYKYSFFLKNNNEKSFSRKFYTTVSFDKNFNINSSGGAGDSFINELPIFGIKNIIYKKFIPEKWVPKKKSAYNVIIEYEKKRQIRYYIEIREKLEKGKYTIYFKSYPPKKILNAKNAYIKD